jgi:hypothetical protein
VTPLRVMRLGRRLLVCAVLAALTRKDEDVGSPALEGSAASIAALAYVRVHDAASRGERKIADWLEPAQSSTSSGMAPSVRSR